MMYPYLSRISYRLKKKGEINATTSSWVIDILYTLVRKAKFDLILQKMTFQEITANVAVEKNIQR